MGACEVPTKSQPVSDLLITTRGASAEWRMLSHAITAAFDGNDQISPDHPCAACLRSCHWLRLNQELRAAGRWVDGCYTRTTLLSDESFTVMLLCWPPGVCSPVHAHSDAATKVKSNCFMLVLEGELCETTYAPDSLLGPDSVDAAAGQSRALAAGGYTYINDGMGVHKVGNASSSERAISLHVYAPGWRTVQTYEETTRAPLASDAAGASFDLHGWGDF